MNLLNPLRDPRDEPAQQLPVNYEAEQALLGAMMTNNLVYRMVVGIVRAEDFADPVHGRIFEAICIIIERGQLANFLTLRNYFDKDPGLEEAGGGNYLARLENAVVTILNCDDYARTIRDLADRRRLIAACRSAINDALDVNIDQPAAAVSANLITEIENGMTNTDDGMISIADVAERVVEGMKTELPCCSTGLPRLDDAIGGGLFQHRLYGLAGFKKDGKSLLMATIAHNQNMAGHRLLYLGLEMGPNEQVQRIMARMMGINSLAFLDCHARQSEELLRDAGQAAVKLRAHDNLLLVQRPRMTLDDVKIIIAKAALSRKVQGVFVDYIQLVTGQKRGDSLATHYDNVAQGLAEATQRYPIWIMAAAQLNRDGNIRQGDGLLNACDMAMALHKIDMVGAPDQAWIEITHSRYTAKGNVGSDSEPALEIVTKAGPYFKEIES